MEATNNVIYSVVIDTPKYLGSITVTETDIGHLVKFELKENNYQVDHCTRSKFLIKACDSYVASTGTDLIILDGYSVDDNWLFTLKCDMDSKLTYHEYQQPTSLTIFKPFDQSQQSEPSSKVNDYRDSVVYQKARKILEMDDDANDDGTILDMVNCDQAFLDKVYKAREHFPSSFFDVGDISLATRDHYIKRETATIKQV